MSRVSKSEMYSRIQSNIEKYGHHVYLVTGGPSPRFAYTIGLSELGQPELVLAGSLFYSNSDVPSIINTIARSTDRLRIGIIGVEALGTFELCKVYESWLNVMLLGVIDYYKGKDVSALQIVPNDAHLTGDVPDMSKPRASESEPVWRWLTGPWNYSVSKGATAVTNLGVLRGQRVTEVVRWEEDEWEMFAGAGSDVKPEEIRKVPLATMLALDESLVVTTELKIKAGLWREADELGWHVWEKQ